MNAKEAIRDQPKEDTERNFISGSFEKKVTDLPRKKIKEPKK
jgi:hypothetical protein